MKTYNIDGHKLSIEDLASFFRQSRGFPSILYLGGIAGEGQTGGRYVSECAQELERQIIADLGEQEYVNQMDVLMGVEE